VQKRHILTWVKLNIASTFHIFHQLQAKFRTEHAHNNVLSDCTLCANQHSKSHNLLRCIHGFLSILSTLISDLGDTQCKKPEINATERL